MAVETLTAAEQKALKTLSETIAKELAVGKNKEGIIKGLVKSGMQQGPAETIVNQIDSAVQTFKNSPEGRAVLLGKYKKSMLYGILWLAGGGILTIATYTIASSSGGGGKYVLAWGAVAFGLIELFRGLLGYLKYKKQ